VFAAFVFCVLPWPAAWWGLYVQHSAPLAFALYHGVCFAGGWLLRSPGLPDPDRVWTLRARHLLFAVLGVNAIMLLAYSLVGAALLSKPAVLSFLSTKGLGPNTYVWLFPYFALVNPLAEEFFWRGGVYPTFRRLFRSRLGAGALAAFFFGAWHWMVIRLFVAPYVALAATLGVMAVGFGLCIVYERTRRIAHPIALHALAADAPLLLLLLLLGRS
jgi:membrane protease YdiL (CAAX protease family)